MTRHDCITTAPPGDTRPNIKLQLGAEFKKFDIFQIYLISSADLFTAYI